MATLSVQFNEEPVKEKINNNNICGALQKERNLGIKNDQTKFQPRLFP